MAATQAAETARLPAETDEFVGRSAELSQLGDLLRDAPLVTLVGPGGVGKSRVALRAAAAAASRYTDGAYFAGLSALRDPELLPHTVGRQLGLAGQAAGPPRDALLAYLRDRRLLLVLDTCEHLIDACAELAEAILAAAPLVTVLATSREALAIAGETIFAIRPLPVGPLPGSTAETGGRPGDAAELFARRAAAAAPGFAVTDANRADVLRICRGLDGIPLAIEMAAGRLRDLPLPEVSRRLDRRLALLSGGSARDGGRHASARNVTAWSYETCTAAERVLWARLSVFPGGFGVDAATEVCASGELSGSAVFQTIVALFNKSVLVRAEPAGGDGGQPWFRMLDTVREFGAERLAASGEEAGIRDRFLARYLAMARQAGELASAGDQLQRFAALHREHAGVRAALDYALDGRPGQSDRERDGAELAARLWVYWLSSGLMAEGRYWLGRVLDRVTRPCPQRAWVHVARCLLAAVHGAIPEALEDGQAGVKLAETLKQPRIAGRGNACLTLAYTLAGELEAAARAGNAAERQLTGAGDTDGLILLDAHLAPLYQAQGRPGESIRYYQRGIARFGDNRGERMYHGYLHLAGAFGYLQLPGREAEAARVLSLALMAKYDLDEVTGTAYGLELLGWLAAGAGRYRRAAWLLGAAGPLWERLGARLSNAAPWEQRHADAVAATAAALGAGPWTALSEAGARHPLDQVVALAINDADTLDGPFPVPPGQVRAR